MLSIIIPHFHEHPQLLFTLQGLINELEFNSIPHELILINNANTPQNDHTELDSVKYIEKKQHAGCLSNVKLLEYMDTLSHWQAKNLGVKHASGELLLFLDAHIVITPNAIKEMLNYFQWLPEHSLLHLPIVYMLENKENRLKYELVHDLDKGIVDYRFAKFMPNSRVTEVPCMSTCGMMVAKSTITDIYQGWPTMLGSYSGGEHFINFVGALLGVRKYIIDEGIVYHYAAPRSYDIVYNDVYRNRAISAFLFGGVELFHKYLVGLCRLERGKISPRLISNIRLEIPSLSELQSRREYIMTNSNTTIEEFINYWSHNEHTS